MESLKKGKDKESIALRRNMAQAFEVNDADVTGIGVGEAMCSEI